MEDRDVFDEDSMTTDSDYEFHIEDLLNNSMSPGLRTGTNFDMPLMRDK